MIIKSSKYNTQQIVRFTLMLTVIISFVAFGVLNIISTLFNKDCIVKSGIFCKDSNYKSVFKKIEIAKQNGLNISSQELKEFTVNEIVHPYIAKDLGIEVENDIIVDRIKKMDIFKKDGQFDLESYKQFLSKYHITDEEYTEEVRSIIIMELTREVLQNLNLGLEDERLKKINLIENEEKDLKIEIQHWQASQIIEKKDITKENIELEYKKNEQKYKEFTKKYLTLDIKDQIFYENRLIIINRSNVRDIKDFIERQFANGKTISYIAEKLHLKNQRPIFKIDKIEELEFQNLQTQAQHTPYVTINNNNNTIQVSQVIKAESRQLAIQQVIGQIIKNVKIEKFIRKFNAMTEEEKEAKKATRIVNISQNAMIEYKLQKEDPILYALTERLLSGVYQQGDYIGEPLHFKDEIFRFKLVTQKPGKFTKDERNYMHKRSRESDLARLEFLYKKYIINKNKISINFKKLEEYIN